MVLTVDVLKNDCEMKLLVGCTPDEAETARRIHDDGSQAGFPGPQGIAIDGSYCSIVGNGSSSLTRACASLMTRPRDIFPPHRLLT